MKQIEEQVREYWKKASMRKKVLAMNKGEKGYYFLDGPPYATGSIHMGTALNKVLKDYYIRYKRMQGYDVWCQPGYDTHGVPIENKVEKELGIQGKQEIEQKVGVETFNKRCREFATRYIGVMNDEFDNLGVWMDWENPYVTLYNDYIEGAWHTFKVAYEKGLLYKGKYPVHVCPQCETAVAYNEIIYDKIADKSVYVKLKIKGKEGEYLLVWTTTPWTLPANTGVMAHPTFTYVKVQTSRGKLILAKDLLERVMHLLDEPDYEVLEEFAGKKLEGIEYENLLELPCQSDFTPRVVMSDRYVNVEDGTGLVHTAPGHGAEDFQVGQQTGLKAISPLSLDGKFLPEAGKYAGMFALDANETIITDLENKGDLLYVEDVSHDYPHCWRCKSKLLLLSVPQWFFKITEIRDKLIEQNREVNWVPDWAGKRFENWLETLGDWPISRQRYWGIPLPIWVCSKCDEIKVIGSAAELPKKVADFHKPYIDNVKFKCKCGGEMSRVPDVLDVWFDSGVAPWASLDYVHDKSLFEKMWPVQFVTEASDQTRGWWNSLAICSMITFGRLPYETVLQHAMVLGIGKVKMSKSLGNIVSPQSFVDKYGRELLRYYLLRLDPTADFEMSWEKADDLKKFFNVLLNTYNFFSLYCRKETLKFDELKPEDKWVLAKLQQLISDVRQNNDRFNGAKSVQLMEDFITNDLSRWYVKLIRDRTWPTYEGKDKKAANATLYYVLRSLTRLLAPVLPHLTEHFYRDVLKCEKESVHMELLPEAESEYVNDELIKEMDSVRLITEANTFARQNAKLKLRWPVASIVVTTEDEATEKAVKHLSELIKEMCNAKELKMNVSLGAEYETVDFPKGKVSVCKHLTPELEEEALSNEVIRTVQELRKKAGYKVEQKINLTVDSEAYVKALKSMAGAVSSKVNASTYSVGDLKGSHKGELDFMGKKIEVAF